MKIVSWNCNMAYARKQQNILALQPDIAIIQECSGKDLYANNAPFRHWVGDNPHKGLGIVGFDTHKYSIDPSYTDSYPWFIPLRIEDIQLNILAIWAHKKNQEERYVRITNKAVVYYKSFLSECSSLIIGDFNSNTIWDKERISLSNAGKARKRKDIHVIYVSPSR